MLLIIPWILTAETATISCFSSSGFLHFSPKPSIIITGIKLEIYIAWNLFETFQYYPTLFSNFLSNKRGISFPTSTSEHKLIKIIYCLLNCLLMKWKLRIDFPNSFLPTVEMRLNFDDKLSDCPFDPFHQFLFVAPNLKDMLYVYE